MNFFNNTRLVSSLENLWVQRFLIIFILTLVFWNGLWGGVPRADQLPYLHQVSQFHNLWDILVNSPSWNRTHSAGDYILFRPLLYLLLGSFYYFFGYNFVLWQIGSLVLHILVVLGIHLLLSVGRLNKTVYPVLLSLFFGTSLLGSELVFWNHISGYILFSVFGVYSIYYLTRFFETKNTRCGWMSLFFVVLSEFTYELGVVLNLLIVLTFFYRYYFVGFDKPAQLGGMRISNIAWGCLYLFGALLYPLLSIFDLWMRMDILNIFSYEATPAIHSWTSTLFLAFWYTIKEISFWIGGWLFPAAYEIDAADRASFKGFQLASASFLLNYATALLLLFSFLSKTGGPRSFLRLGNREAWFAAFLSILFLFAYAFIIAWGRALPRGLNYVFNSNIYYSYIACLAVIIGVALFAFNKSAEPLGKNVVERAVIASDGDLLSFFNRGSFIVLGIIALTFFNAYNVFLLGESYRYIFSPSRQELINDISGWLVTQGKAPSAYFTVSSNCLGNAPLPWFNQGHFRKNSGWGPPVSFSDVLWPEKSFNLNKEKLHNRKDYSLTEIKCSEVFASSKLGEYGSQGLMSAVNPGWHAASPVVYPQSLTIDFIHPRMVHQIAFLPQNGQPNRAPKSVRVEASIDGTQWNNISSEDIECSSDSEQWNTVPITSPINARYLRINILSNCGDLTLLTLRGLRVE